MRNLIDLIENITEATEQVLHGDEFFETYGWVEWPEDDVLIEAEYKGRKVKLNKPFRTPGGPKKFAVYVKNEKGNVVLVRFGDPNMRIKKWIPARKKNFRARHRCDTDPAPTWTPRYWSCRAW